MPRRARFTEPRPRTDAGTVVLHWSAAAAIAVCIASGLAIAADGPGRTWLAPLKSVLPAGDVWRLHIAAGLGLIAVAAAYAAYIRRAGLTPRIRLDRARTAALRRRGRGRSSAVKVVLYWLLFGLVALQAITGALLYLGHGGVLVTLHLGVGLAILVWPVLHVLAEYAHGHLRHVLRILRPGPLASGPRPPTLPEIVREHLEELDRRARRLDTKDPPARPAAPTGPTTLSSHPLAVAAATGLTLIAVVSTVDLGARDRLVVVAIDPSEVPRLDGDLADPVWRRARPTTVSTNQGANLGGTGSSTVTIRAVHDRTTAYLAVTWDDPTRSLQHLPLVKRHDGWHLVHTRYDIEDEDSFYEDKLSVMLADSARMPAGGAIGLGAQPVPGAPAAMSGRGLHFTTDGSIVDVWHWKAARGGLLGVMDDNWFGPPAEPTAAEREGRSRYKAGYQTDPGKAFYANNFDAQPPGGYRVAITPKRLPKDLAATQKAMGSAKLDPDQSMPEGARWWMTEAESQPWSAEADAAIPVGTVIPGVLIQGTYEGDRADVKAAARWAAGRWTLEIARRLDTGSRHDVAIRSGVAMWVAVFDHTQTRHTRHLRPIILEVE